MEINLVLKNSFKKWLDTLGYAQSTVSCSVHYVKDFFFYLKNTEITNLEGIKPETIGTYFTYLQNRKKKNQNGGLSNNYIISNINALKRFSRYLQETGKANIEIRPKLKAEKENTKTILTKAEIAALYKACGNDYLGIRDRAMLSIFYGCGLRKSEGQQLDIGDILLKEKRVSVGKGKNYKERYVPMTEAVKDDLENYIYVAREKILSFKKVNENALFLSIRAKRLGGNGLTGRLKKLLQSANIQKDIGLHALRHSIATHLLQSGLELEEVKQFLGHASLESTQIYTHVSSEASA
jgi:integrase/recombinase XerD